MHFACISSKSDRISKIQVERSYLSSNVWFLLFAKLHFCSDPLEDLQWTDRSIEQYIDSMDKRQPDLGDYEVDDDEELPALEPTGQSVSDFFTYCLKSSLSRAVCTPCAVGTSVPFVLPFCLYYRAICTPVSMQLPPVLALYSPWILQAHPHYLL